MRVPRKLKKQIPKNTPYCYTHLSGMIYPTDGQLPYYKIKLCHLYGRATNGESYCKLFNKATDNVEWDCLLSDQCKVCGIKTDY